MASNFLLEMGGGDQITESTYAIGEGYIESIGVCTRKGGGGQILALVCMY